MAVTNNKTTVTVIILVVVGFIVYSILLMPDQRTAGERLGDAVDALPQGVDKAAEQLEKRTPGEKLGDAVKDAGEDIKRNTNND